MWEDIKKIRVCQEYFLQNGKKILTKSSLEDILRRYFYFSMKKYFLGFVITLALFGFSHQAQAEYFAPNDPGINIGTNLEPGYEPSGIVWHNRLQSLFLIWDNGSITQMDIDGTILHPSVFIGNGFDLEDITVVDEHSNFVYLLNEFPQRIVEFDITTWQRTGRTWNLLGMPGDRSDGAEALTYNPNTQEFYVGAQKNGQIYVYPVDLQNPSDVNFSRTIATNRPGDIAGLNYSPETKHIYALFDSANIIQEYDSHDVRLPQQFDVPGIEQEGLVILPGCPNASAPIIIAEDKGLNGADGRVMKYGSYPLSCIPSYTDNDRDGSMADVDCNDTNAAIHPRALEILNDGINNDCRASTPDSVITYNSLSLLRSFTTEIKKDYHVFDAPGEYSYVKIPNRLQKQWYAFEVEARTNSLDQLYSFGIYIPQTLYFHRETKLIDSTKWKKYTFYVQIPANTAADVRFVSDVTGKTPLGGKREQNLRSVKVTRLEQVPFYLNL